ncbi:MAG: winged helix-turn-helix transcriptional regulator [Candidatus Thorarchaeota archaeon]
MDLVDKTIMHEISANCRVSYESLSRKTGLSANAVKNRVTALLDSGTISRFAVALQATMINAEFFMALVFTDGTEDIDEFVKRMGESPMVGHVSLLASAGGGAYLVWGQYIGSIMLPELREFLHTPPEVQEIELHTIIGPMGNKTKLAKLHLRILAILKKNPRALINDIANETKLAPKTIRRAIRELAEGDSIVFSARPDMAAGKLVNFYVHFEWNEDETTLEKVATWLREKYPLELWDPTSSASEPSFFAEFVVENLHEAEEIARAIRNADFVKSTATLVSYSNQKFTYFAETMLDEMIHEAGF